MSTTEMADFHKFQPLATMQYDTMQTISSGLGKLSYQDALKETFEKEDNHKLSVQKIKTSNKPLINKRQYIDKQGGAIILPEADVSLHIPPGALRERTAITITVKSARNCDTTRLDQSTSLTPIVSCQPDGLIFQKVVELILPHCAEFDDICLHKATARFVEGDVNVSTDLTNRQDGVQCVLKERHCHVYTTHFSDVEVSIIKSKGCLKKRMLAVPFSRGSTKLYVKVWIINNLPSEYTILLHEQQKLNFVPFGNTGKFIFENHEQCSLKVQWSQGDKKLIEDSKDIDIKQLFQNVRSAYDFEMERTVTDSSPMCATVSFFKEPVFSLTKEIQDGDGVESMQEECGAPDETETQHADLSQTQTKPDELLQERDNIPVYQDRLEEQNKTYQELLKEKNMRIQELLKEKDKRYQLEERRERELIFQEERRERELKFMEERRERELKFMEERRERELKFMEARRERELKFMEDRRERDLKLQEERQETPLQLEKKNNPQFLQNIQENNPQLPESMRGCLSVSQMLHENNTFLLQRTQENKAEWTEQEEHEEEEDDSNGILKQLQPVEPEPLELSSSLKK